MAILQQGLVLVSIAVVLVVTAAANDESSSSSDPIPAHGPSLAQGAVKFQGAAHASEMINPEPMAAFASLDDIFDGEAEKPVQAEVGAFSLPKWLASPSLYFTSAFAGLDDIFDDQAETAVQAEVEAEVEVVEFSMSKWLANPSLYFTIALLIFGGLLLTSSYQETEQEEPQASAPSTAAPTAPAPSTATPTAPVAAADTRAAAAAAADARAADAAKVTAISRPTPISSTPALNIGAATEAKEAHAASPVEPAALLAAADACRAGQAGSYANFCKLLAAQHNVQ